MQIGLRTRIAVLLVILLALALLLYGMRSMRQAGSAGDYPLLSTEEAELRYPYSHLNEREKALYSTLLGGIRDHAEWITLPETYTDKEYERIYLMVGMQEPELFALSDTYELAEQMAEVHIRYDCDAAETAAMTERMDAAAEKILKHISPTQTENQKLLMLHDMLAEHTEYLETAHSSTAYGALAEGMAQCEGYAKAYLYLARKAGLNVMNVSGKSKGTPHVWNAAKIGSSYYNIDVTWDDSESFQGKVGHSYYAMPDDLWGDHTAETDIYTPPQCRSAKETYYQTRGLVLNNINEIDTKLERWIGMYPLTEFQCSSADILTKAMEAIRSNPETMNTISRKCGGSWSYVCDRERRVVVILT